jgi:hypothetical protein
MWTVAVNGANVGVGMYVKGAREGIPFTTVKVCDPKGFSPTFMNEHGHMLPSAGE